MQRRGRALRAVLDEPASAEAVEDEASEMGPGSGPGLRPAGQGSPAGLEFSPVPRKYRFDGWTPERQRAFILALADTGCVSRAARMVNIAQTNAYELRRAPGAEEFRRAWDSALDFGLKRLKDIAFERAIEGQLVPLFQSGKLIGYRRVYNDKLLIFCLRHYGEDGKGKRTTINYFSTRASAGSVLRDEASTGSASPQDERSGAEASAVTVRTVITGSGGGGGAEREDEAAAVLEGFEGVELDAEAAAAIQAAIEACAARARAAGEAYDRGGESAADAAEQDPEAVFFRSTDFSRGDMESAARLEEFVPFVPGEGHWSDAGAEMPAALAELLDRTESPGAPAPNLHGPRTRDASDRPSGAGQANGED